jgi:hypothetical protein
MILDVVLVSNVVLCADALMLLGGGRRIYKGKGEEKRGE